VPRIRRSDLPDGYFHVWTRGVAADTMFPAAEDRTELFRQLNWRYARSFNRRYVLLNAVKARLCERVEDWPWSYSRYGLHAS
jgi:hypothetical protein